MKDLLPDLGEGFITDCLKYYEMDSEQVVNAILEENLPPILSNADRSASTSVELGSSSNSIEHNHKSTFEPKEKKLKVDCSEKQSTSGSTSNLPLIDISEKLLHMHPLNLFYNKVKDSPKTHKDKRSLYFTDLLHPSLGALKSSLQINFMVEFEWLIMNYEVAKCHMKPLTIIYGEENAELAVNNGQIKPNVIAKRVKPRYPFGTHHTKMMILVYEDNSVRVVVHTSNLISSDWENRTQGLWVSPKCPILKESTTKNIRIETIGDSETHFKKSLLSYLNFYEVSVLRPFIEKIKQCDFSAVNAFFVGSVPGSHVINRSDPFQNWGHAFVAKILSKYNNIDDTLKEEEDSDIIFQSSSIGSLGPNIESSFLMELAASFNASTLRTTKKVPKTVRVVYPTKENVFSAFGGPLYGGGCLPYSSKTSVKQPWLRDVMCLWESETIFRTRAMPHIKSYTKLNGYCSQGKASKTRPTASYFLLTSANLSKAAWGSLNKSEDKLWIQSYEAGVLLLPRFTHGLSHQKYAVTAESATKPAELVLPYDLPLTEYQPKDVPWVTDYFREFL